MGYLLDNNTGQILTDSSGNRLTDSLPLVVSNLVEDNTLNYHGASYIFGGSASTSYICSCYLKSSNRQVWFQIADSNSIGGTNVYFDLQNGTIFNYITWGSGGWTNGFSSSITNVGNGWWICTVTITIPSGISSSQFSIGISSSRVDDYTGDGTSYAEIYIPSLSLASGGPNLLPNFALFTPFATSITSSNDTPPGNTVYQLSITIIQPQNTSIINFTLSVLFYILRKTFLVGH